jgi:NADP-dependent 3-hydroxy acid dehydrogenase YdfG
MSKMIAIVGAGPGIGLAIAQRFGREDFNVALIARDAKKLDELVAQLKSQGVESAAFAADVLDRPALVRALEAATARFGTLDVLEYGPVPASTTLRSPRRIDVQNQKFQLDFGVLGAVEAVQAVLPKMLERKSGSLLFTTAASARYPLAFTASFGVAAGAVRNYARVLFQDLKPDGIYAGIVLVAGLVVARGQEKTLHPTGLPVMLASDVAELHWQLHTTRNRAEAAVGDIEAIKAHMGP